MGKNDDPQIVLRILAQLLRPIVGFCLRRNVGMRDFENVARGVFVRTALSQLEKSETKPSTARLSVLTGIYRKDVDRILAESEVIPSSNVSILMRVVGQWEQDRHYQTSRGEPRTLPCVGEDSVFYSLVRKVSKNHHPSTVLAEMVRNGIAEITPKGAKFLRSTVVIGGDKSKFYEAAADDIQTILRCVEENIDHADGMGNLHHRTVADNIYADRLPEIKKWILQEGRKFHKRLRTYLARYDKDIRKESRASSKTDRKHQAGATVVVGSFSLTISPTDETPPPSAD